MLLLTLFILLLIFILLLLILFLLLDLKLFYHSYPITLLNPTGYYTYQQV